MICFAKWVSLVLTAATLGVAAASMLYTVDCRLGPRQTIELSFGSIGYEKRLYAPCVRLFSLDEPAFSIYPNDMRPWEARLQLFRSHAVPAISGGVNAPLWIPAVVFGGMAGWLLRRGKRRVSAGYCAACGYDLMGNVSGRCSECGVVTEKCG